VPHSVTGHGGIDSVTAWDFFCTSLCRIWAGCPAPWRLLCDARLSDWQHVLAVLDAVLCFYI